MAIKQTFANRIAPAIIVAGVIACAWAAVASQPKAVSVLPQTSQAATASAKPQITDSQEPIANIAPLVQTTPGNVEFVLDTKAFKQVQKVEFYVENKLVGASFSLPFTVTVAQKDLSAGTHTVTAKVYTSTGTSQTTPALFTAGTTATPAIVDPQDESTPAVVDSQSTQPIAAGQGTSPGLAIPTNVTGTASDDGTSANISWGSVAGASTYQVWRDNAPITTVSTLVYTDTSLIPGQTYDYAVVAMASDSTVSQPSAQVAVTMPTPPANNGAPAKNPPGGSSNSAAATPPSGGTDTSNQ